MPLNPVTEDDLRRALRPCRAEPQAFVAGVRRRLAAADPDAAPDPLVGSSPLLRSAAAFFPLGILVGCKTSGPAAQGTSAVGGAGGHGLLGYLTFPAVSLFFLLGAGLFSAMRLRNIEWGEGPERRDAEGRAEAIRQWWADHKLAAQAVYLVSVLLALIGKSGLLFAMYVVSFGILASVVAAFARRGLGDRQLVASTCGTALMFLGQLAAFTGVGQNEIHFLDQRLVAAVFFSGALLVLPLGLRGPRPAANRVEKPPRWTWLLVVVTLGLLIAAGLGLPSLARPAVGLGAILVILAVRIFRSTTSGWRVGAGSARTLVVVSLLLIVPLIGWMASSILVPATPARIRSYVESFDHAEHSTISWRRWEIAAEWAERSMPNLDLTKPRRLLAEEIAGEQNPFILGSAARAGLLQADQVGGFKNYETLRRSLVKESPGGMPQALLFLDQTDWVVRGAVLRDELSPEERNRLEERLRVTLAGLWENEFVVLSDPLRVTEWLRLIGRPVEVERDRARVHDLLRRFHTQHGGGFQLAGGFKRYLGTSTESWVSMPGNLEATADAIGLMEVYGVPEGLDLNWVRSFLRPSMARFGGEQWVAAVLLDRLNHLPGVSESSWSERLSYERPLLAALVLVGLCLYAVKVSPVPHTL